MPGTYLYVELGGYLERFCGTTDDYMSQSGSFLEECRR